MAPAARRPSPASSHWLNRTVVGIGLALLFSDWSHEIATTAMPAFLATMGATVAFGFSAVLFIAGAGIILTLRPKHIG